MKSYEEWCLEHKGWIGIAHRQLRDQRNGIDVHGLRNHEDQQDDDFLFEFEGEYRPVIRIIEHQYVKTPFCIEAWMVRNTAETLKTSTHEQDEFLTSIIEACKGSPNNALFGFTYKQFRWFSHLVKTSNEPCNLMRKKLEKIQLRGSGI